MIDLNGVVQAIGERNLKLYRTVSGIRIEGDCTAEVVEAIRQHQQTLLPFIASAEDFEQVAEQQAAAEMGRCEDCGKVLVETLTFDDFLDLECPACDRCFSCRPSTGAVAARFAGKPVNPIQICAESLEVIGEVYPCIRCRGLELWESAAGDLFGLTPGRWRCMKCDPPTAARRLAEAAERIRRRANRRADTRHKG